jgi:hypothetical protein
MYSLVFSNGTIVLCMHVLYFIAMRKCDDEIYQLAKDQALVRKLKKLKI